MTYSTFIAHDLQDDRLNFTQDMPFSEVRAKAIKAGVKAKELNTSTAKYFGLKEAALPTKSKGIEESLLGDINLGVAKTNLFLPLEQKSDGTVVAAVSDPTRAMQIADDYARTTGKNITLTYASPEELTDFINTLWDKKATSAKDAVKDTEEESTDLQSMASALGEPEDLLDSEHDAPIIKLINSILMQAAKEGASDIHIEPSAKQVSVRFRVDGVMHTVITPSAKLHAAMSARLKVMASLDIAEKRLPQDGRFKIRIGGKDTDIRISTLPTQHGERIVLRLLGQQDGIRALGAIGLRPEQKDQIEGFFGLANGIMLVSGPTGSGKTSTLYAGLQHINTPDKNIVTVEDPVEYELEGLGQIPVNAKIGMTFAAGLRSILRQDPDVVVVGETRDLETAEIAVEASLTGHLVLSTIHTNDAPSTLTRLIEMGIEPFLVASSLRGVVAQRMVRLLHPTTKVPRALDAETKKIFDALPKEIRPKEITLFSAASSDDCPTGYTGRSGIFEILTITDKVRTVIQAGGNDSEIRDVAQSEGMLTLYQEGLLKAARGETTLEEVMRVTRIQ
ncbi:MAG: ATPase, T2SS/T4P/T4SS family [Alphaproteobacteria bacterium]|nr:ATPase, T2SS/T4P/T4SS family [Alphaproteobacteria bacterium]